MLNSAQIQTLSKVGQLKLRICNGIPIAVSSTPDIEIKYPYELFKKQMGLEDLRLDWLLSSNNMIAGGSVLNWIWGENTHEDIDFFFKDRESADMFSRFIQGIGFKLVKSTGYANTYFESSQGVILQVIGDTNRDPIDNDFIAYGSPQKIINNFDFYVCKFAVDSDYLYTTSRAIQDLLKLTIDNTNTGNEKNYFLSRVLKYTRKGFFLSSKIKGSINYDKPAICNKNTNEQKWSV